MLLDGQHTGLSCGIQLESYDGQDVDDQLLEQAIDFMVSLENADIESLDQYRKILEANKDVVTKANAIFRKYGEQITPPTFTVMRDVFDRITRAEKYACDPRAGSVASTCLNEAWDGIGEWRK